MAGVVEASTMAHLAMISSRIHNPNAPFEKATFNHLPIFTTTSLSLPNSSGSKFLSSHEQKRLTNRFNVATSTAISSVVSTQNEELPYEPEVEVEDDIQGEKFDWYEQWYPVMPVCDLDKRVPLGKRVMGLDVVVWWDKNEDQWKVFDDKCPHRLAPLSEGRIDQWGRLQCVYHGWCFNASGNCQLIPQAPPDGPPVNTFKRACVAVYPSTVQNGIVWFWPNSDPKFKDILQNKQPPFIPELDDPSYTNLVSNREIPYGYEVLIENLMDPSHVPYAHYGLMQTPKPKIRADREGGRPLDMSVKQLDINGFTAKQEWGASKFIAPCIFYAFPNPPPTDNGNGSVPSAATTKDSSATVPSQRRALLIFICIPVSPGKSRLIWSFPRNFAVWMDRIIPRWIFHLRQNLILDSDLYLLHVQERKIMELGPSNWQKVCFVPTKADALVVGYRRWLNKYSGGQVDWGTKFNGGALPPTPPREELLDRYWSHVVNCSSCHAAYKALKVAETVLQIVSIGLIGVIGLTKQAAMTTFRRSALFSVAILCFAASKWLSHFVYKYFHFHDYNHALV